MFDTHHYLNDNSSTYTNKIQKKKNRNINIDKIAACYADNITITDEDKHYLTQILPKLLIVSAGSCSRKPNYDSNKCGIPIYQYLVCDEFYIIDNVFYDRIDQQCHYRYHTESTYNTDCHCYDFTFLIMYLYQSNFTEKSNIEWILILEDDTKLCPDLSQFIYDIINNNFNVTKDQPINIVFIGMGMTGILIRVSYLSKFSNLVTISARQVLERRYNYFAKLDAFGIDAEIWKNALYPTPNLSISGMYFSLYSFLWHPSYIKSKSLSAHKYYVDFDCGKKLDTGPLRIYNHTLLKGRQFLNPYNKSHVHKFD